VGGNGDVDSCVGEITGRGGRGHVFVGDTIRGGQCRVSGNNKKRELYSKGRKPRVRRVYPRSLVADVELLAV